MPPSSVFPVAWTSLYTDIAITSAAVIDKLRSTGRRTEARNYAVALGVNLTINAGWSWLFFRYHKLGAAAVGAAVLACFVLDPRLEASSGQRRMQFLCDSLQQLSTI